MYRMSNTLRISIAVNKLFRGVIIHFCTLVRATIEILVLVGQLFG